MAQDSTAPVSRPSSDPLQPGTYSSLLPIVDDILETLHAQTVSPERISPAQSSEQVAPKAKELAHNLETMKMAALSLPGGHLSVEQIHELIDVLDEEGDKRRRILNAFESLETPVVDAMGSGGV